MSGSTEGGAPRAPRRSGVVAPRVSWGGDLRDPSAGCVVVPPAAGTFTATGSVASNCTPGSAARGLASPAASGVRRVRDRLEDAGEEGRPERYRATSGSEAGLELIPQQANLTEVYGFVAWITTIMALVGFFLWAFLPEDTLHYFGVTYYPNRYWSLAASAVIIMLVATYGLLYAAVGMANNPHIDSFDALSDGYSRVWHHAHTLAQQRRAALPPAAPAHPPTAAVDEAAVDAAAVSRRAAMRRNRTQSDVASDEAALLRDSVAPVRPLPAGVLATLTPGEGDAPAVGSLKMVRSMSVPSRVAELPSLSGTSGAARRATSVRPAGSSVGGATAGAAAFASGTPDIADLPVTVINRLQFFVTPAVLRRAIVRQDAVASHA
ncbi:hypothetical protein EON68_00045 [archaeon]|nr:MAG: hypothetical protein EON68_00045 [archaeon]